MAPKDYASLYALQDDALSIVFAEKLGFYLSGGTALARFYLHHRHSDDLDFFTNDVQSFSDTFRLLFRKLSGSWRDTALEVDSRDFKRLRLSQEKENLKIDFIADRVSRIGIPVSLGEAYVDTVRNILSNKLCALLDRDEARDVADLLHISLARRFSWADIVAEAASKQLVTAEELAYRMDTFPIASLAKVPLISPLPLAEYDSLRVRIRDDIAGLSENSAAAEGSAIL